MPFFEPATDRIGFELTPGMPRPLVVAVLDKAQERSGRTTASLVETARQIMYSAVQVGGKKAWRRAAGDWKNTFADPVTGATIDPLFAREQAFVGQPHGPVRL